MDPVGSVDELVVFLAGCDEVFDSLGADGDPVDILDHSLQCAAELARLAPDDVELQVAGLVHDLGHVVVPGSVSDHGAVGAAFVARLLGDRIARLTALHVPAKRYLVATDPTYRDGLSPGSTISLVHQGGAMDAAEVRAYASDPQGAHAVVLRRADEAAKVIGRTVPGLEHWVPSLRAVADRA